MIPLRDNNPTLSKPLLVYGLVALNVLVFLYEFTLSEVALRRLFYEYSVVPVLLTGDPYSLEALLDILRSMFLHGGWLHLASNMLYLWIFGDNMEERFGSLGFLLLYFSSGLVAVLAQVAISPESTIPLVGASGAIAGILGAYIVLYPHARIVSIIMIGFVFVQPIRALYVLGFWFLTQLFNGVASVGTQTATGGGVAFFAHIGGFVAGMAFGLLYLALKGRPEIRAPRVAAPGQLFPRRNLQAQQGPPLAAVPPSSAGDAALPDSPMLSQMQFQALLDRLEYSRQTRQAVAVDTVDGVTYFGIVLRLHEGALTLLDYRDANIKIPLGMIVQVR